MKIRQSRRINMQTHQIKQITDQKSLSGNSVELTRSCGSVRWSYQCAISQLTSRCGYLNYFASSVFSRNKIEFSLRDQNHFLQLSTLCERFLSPFFSSTIVGDS
ncbi:hypothetical protein X798_07305, partial [Onchocerca flexuosa]